MSQKLRIAQKKVIHAKYERQIISKTLRGGSRLLRIEILISSVFITV